MIDILSAITNSELHINNNVSNCDRELKNFFTKAKQESA